jgi:hypothetical protein
MIVVLSELHGAPRVFEVDRQGLIDLARLIHEGAAVEEQAPGAELDAFDFAWVRLRRRVRHVRHFATFHAALHFYRCGNHGLEEAAATRVVRELVKVRAVAPEPWPGVAPDATPACPQEVGVLARTGRFRR